ncbi:hypothetical protein LCGC14_2023500 [marine sediment metagenome]|uniref:Uncharacterized protein n=1 Tax=marine sediment metagenome TaxID=412755 RepID=A0A0F9HTW0_9ZZZZ
MANVYNKLGKLWELTTDDILIFPRRGVTRIRKIFCQMDSEADIVQFETINFNTAAVHDLTLTNLTFSGTNTITDADGGSVMSSTAAGQWINITDCTTAANNGWWYLKTDTDANNQIVEIGANIDAAAHALTNGTTQTARLRFYGAETCMAIVNDTLGGSSSVHHPTLDWETRGRFFPSLSMTGFTGATCYVYIE